jgi:hypothetical protein
MFFKKMQKAISSKIPVQALRTTVMQRLPEIIMFWVFFHCPTNRLSPMAQMRPS